MGTKQDVFRERLAAAFRSEAAEHVAAISSGLSELDRPSPPVNAQEIIETTFREMHTLKGAARSVNETEIESLCQSAESALSSLRHGKITFSRSLADLIFLTLGRVNSIIENKNADMASSSAPIATTHDLIAALELAANNEPVPQDSVQNIPPLVAGFPPSMEQHPETPDSDSPFTVKSTPPISLPSLSEKTGTVALAADTRKVREMNGTIRVSASKMDAILHQAEELIAQKESLSRNVKELEGIAELLDSAKKEWLLFSFDSEKAPSSFKTLVPSSAKVSGRKENHYDSRKLATFARQYITILTELDARITEGSFASRQELHTFNLNVDALIADVREVMLVPASSVLMFLPLSVQEMAASTGKEAGLVIEGGDQLVDRRILEGMKEPLIHIVRNAVDHGIEPPDERTLAGKPVKGKITVSVEEKGHNRIELVVSDDGRGIDINRVKAAALKNGLAEAGVLERMDNSGIIRLLFRSGLSTSPIITELSGRGIGLSIVEEQVEHFDGEVTIQTSEGKGTRVQITLPVRLATLRGVIVRSGNQFFIIPRVYAEQVLRVDEREVQRVENRKMIRHRGETIPLINLAALLDLSRSSSQTPERPTMFACVIVSGSTRIALEVNEIIREQEFSQKSLGPQLDRASNFAGAVIGGGGKVIPVLNIADLVKAVISGGFATEQEEVTMVETPKIKKLLVVEDSITARTLLKNILEGAGYFVKTAVDGMDAWTVLKTDPFELVVSDVEMPLMNGFDLTTAIRHDHTLSNLPVILVTALASRHDRERGIDAGANAYIVKSSFDQSNLLDVIRRLIG